MIDFPLNSDKSGRAIESRKLVGCFHSSKGKDKIENAGEFGNVGVVNEDVELFR
jgi:hypothetical protein